MQSTKLIIKIISYYNKIKRFCEWYKGWLFLNTKSSNEHVMVPDKNHTYHEVHHSKVLGHLGQLLAWLGLVLVVLLLINLLYPILILGIGVAIIVIILKDLSKIKEKGHKK